MILRSFFSESKLPCLWDGDENWSLLLCVLQCNEQQLRSLVCKFCVSQSALQMLVVFLGCLFYEVR